MDEPSEPFDEFGHSQGSVQDVRRGVLSHWTRAGLRAMSFTGLWVAIVTMGLIIVRHALPLITGSPPVIFLKSAIPLIAVGLSYLCLIATLRRTPGQRIVGISVGLAFVLWGLEQFLTDPAVISLIDDVVVFFFVVDLSIVIRHNLARCANESRLRKAPMRK